MKLAWTALLVIAGCGSAGPPPTSPAKVAVARKAPDAARHPRPALAKRTASGPSLPLPEVTPEMLGDWPADKPIPNSLRAWHYRPEMRQHLGATIDAIMDNATLERDVITRLIAVVASRNGCLY